MDMLEWEILRNLDEAVQKYVVEAAFGDDNKMFGRQSFS